ncbi:hypothetical protein BDZ88DRAFT_421251 [Geranomyces variabilis]|nr:hypothetical protein BDZ88DRAFT_421251 [Geranomyces variabilis]
MPHTIRPPHIQSSTSIMSSDAENNHPVWEDLRRYAGGSMWKDAFLAAIDGAEESVNDARRAKAALEAESAGFFNMAQAAMDAAAACGPSPGFLRGLCGDVCAILQADPLRKTLLLEGHFLAFLPATLAARIVAKCCSEKALRAMEMAYYTATLDVSNLPQVKRVDTSPVVYLHSARARSIDGPNALPTSTNLVYVGSALGHQGAVKRVFSNHLVRWPNRVTTGRRATSSTAVCGADLPRYVPLGAVLGRYDPLAPPQVGAAGNGPVRGRVRGT